MNLNQASVFAADMEASWAFYLALGLIPIVDARPRYARFLCPEGEATFSLKAGTPEGEGGATLYFEIADLDAAYEALQAKGIRFDSPPQDQPWLWREAHLRDPSGNRLILYRAGANRIDPPWRVKPA